MPRTGFWGFGEQYVRLLRMFFVQLRIAPRLSSSLPSSAMDVAALRHSGKATSALTEAAIRSHVLPQQPSLVRVGPEVRRRPVDRLATTAWGQGPGSPARTPRQGRPSGAVLASGASMSPPVDVLRVAAGSVKAEKEVSGSSLDRLFRRCCWRSGLSCPRHSSGWRLRAGRSPPEQACRRWMQPRLRLLASSSDCSRWMEKTWTSSGCVSEKKREGTLRQSRPWPATCTPPS